MAKLKITEIKSKKSWEKFVLSRKEKTFLQSWNWGEVKKSNGSWIYRFGIYDGSKLVGVCQLIEEKARRGPHLLVPSGPLIDWRDERVVKIFTKVVKQIAKKRDSWFIRIRPEVIDSLSLKIAFKKYGFISAPMHLHAENTWVLNIEKDENLLLSEMRKTTRYLIRRSWKEGLKLKVDSDTKNAETLYRLQDETAKRHHFVGFSKSLFESEIEIFGKDKQALVFTVLKGKEVLAAAIIIFYGETAYYHHSGSTSEYSKIPFSYFLQWEIIKYAKSKGIRYYNFWGISPEGKTNHRFSGVTIFKTGFGGYRRDYLHAQDLPVSLYYWLTYIFETTRKVFRNL